jgi:hypothetical protein
LVYIRNRDDLPTDKWLVDITANFKCKRAIVCMFLLINVKQSEDQHMEKIETSISKSFPPIDQFKVACTLRMLIYDDLLPKTQVWLSIVLVIFFT